MKAIETVAARLGWEIRYHSVKPKDKQIILGIVINRRFYSKKGLLQTNHKWIAEKAVREVCGDDKEKWMKFYDLITMGGIDDYQDFSAIFNATPEQIYLALAEVLKEE
jgi:hypothetical protein